MTASDEPGGLTGWSASERARYARHFLLPGVGPAGQERLRAARVLLVGAGGLGSPAATYLAAAGVGTLGIVDDDVVELSNLQRQVLHGTADVGRPKVDSALARLRELNPHVAIEAVAERVTAATVLDLVSSYDVVVDGTDNFATRYLLSDACVLAGRPLVWGAVSAFDGQVSVWWPGRGPCYRCVFPTPPPPGSVPSCAEGGVLGAVPGLIGTWQAAEVLKILLGVGEPLVGRLLVVDVLSGEVGTVPLRRHPGCPACAPGARLEPTDLDEATCAADGASGLAAGRDGVADVRGDEPAPRDVDPAEAAAWLTSGRPPVLLDVREAVERAIVVLPFEQQWIPLGELRADPAGALRDVPAERDVLVYCRSGVRSDEAAALLRAAGHPRAVNLLGGVLGWRAVLDPEMPAY